MLECLKRVLYCEVFIKKSFLLFNVIYSVCSSHHARLMCMTYLNACSMLCPLELRNLIHTYLHNLTCQKPMFGCLQLRTTHFTWFHDTAGSDDSNNVPAIVGGSIGAVVIVLIIVVISFR